MKRIIWIVLCFCLLFHLFSCSHDSIEPTDYDRYQLPEVPEAREYDFPEWVMGGDIYGSSFYFCEKDSSAVRVLSLETGEITTLVENSGAPRSLSADRDGVYVVDEESGTLTVYSFEGEKTAAIDLPARPEASGEALPRIGRMEHFGGVTALAYPDSVWTIADGKKSWKKCDMPILESEYFDGVWLKTSKRLIVLIKAELSEYQKLDRIYECDLDGKNAVLLTEAVTSNLVVNEGHVYLFSNVNGNKIFEVDRDGKYYVQKQNYPRYDPNKLTKQMGIVQTAAISNGTVFTLWYADKCVSVEPLNDAERSVLILASEDDGARLDQISKAVIAFPTQYELLDPASFHDKVITRLLSNDDSFDLVLIRGDAEETKTMLRAVLRNKLFVDLCGNDRLAANLTGMYEGVQSLMTYNDAFFALPLGFEHTFFGFTGAAQSSGLNLPSPVWSTDELFHIAESLDGRNFTVFPDNPAIVGRLMLPVLVSDIQRNVNPLNSVSRTAADTAITGLLTEIDAHRHQLFGKMPLFTQIGHGIFHMESVTKSSEDALFALPPAKQPKFAKTGNPKKGRPDIVLYSASPVSGSSPITMNSFIFINPFSNRIDEALSVLADLTDEGNRYDAFLFDSPLYPDLSRYYRDIEMEYDEETQSTVLNPHRENAVDLTYPAYVEHLDAFMDEYYRQSELCLIPISDKIAEVFLSFCSGETDAEQAAKVIGDEVVYRLEG